jgi:radical SAM superfamily enzyme YgiQ (UPF0313 family)
MKCDKSILLISANQLKEPYPIYPIGLSYLSTYFQKKNKHFKIVIYDMNIDGLDGLSMILKEIKPLYIGISLRNIDDTNSFSYRSFVSEYKNIVETIRKESRAKIILGGAGFTLFPKYLFEILDVDFGIVGEGEESFYQLVMSLQKNEEYENIEGLVYRSNDKISINTRISFTKSLDLNYDDNLVGYYWKKSGMINIQTKRGCPFKCIYCTYPIIEGAHIRLLDPEKVVRSLENLQQKHGIGYVFFTDSVFNIANEYNKLLSQKIIESGLKINWGAYFTLNNLDEEMLTLYKSAGLTHIEFGTESISDIQLKNYGKHFTVQDVIEKSKLCNKLKVNFAHFVILGGYGETEGTLEETFHNAKEIHDSVFFAYVGMRIYPGTKLSEISIQESVISKEDNLLEAKFYISKNIDVASIKGKALQTGKRWIFPDDDISKVVNIMRDKGWKGPLWEHAKF